MSFSPVTGRFMQRDPLGYVDGRNIYQYEASGPAARLDASGNDTKKSPWPPKKKEDIWDKYLWIPTGQECGKGEDDGKVRAIAVPSPGPDFVRVIDYAEVQSCFYCLGDKQELGEQTAYYRRTVRIKAGAPVAYVCVDGYKMIVLTPELEDTTVLLRATNCYPPGGIRTA